MMSPAAEGFKAAVAEHVRNEGFVAEICPRGVLVSLPSRRVGKSEVALAVPETEGALRQREEKVLIDLS